MVEPEEHVGQSDKDRRSPQRWLIVLLAVPVLYGLLWFAAEWKDSLEDRCGYTPPGHEHDPAYPAWGNDGWSYEWGASGLRCTYSSGEVLEVGWFP